VSVENDIRNLSQIPIFGVLEDDARRLIAFSAETRILRAGDVLFRRGDRSDSGYVLTSGVIALDAHDDGSAAMLVSTPFTLIGELALVSETERPVTAMARQPSTVLKIPRTLFYRVLRDYPISARNMRAMMGMRLEILIRELDTLAKGWDVGPEKLQ
jgi:CRP-like cAMP-binding protein